MDDENTPSPIDGVDIEMVDFSQEVIVMADGTVLPITLILDAAGEETEDLDEVAFIMAGSPEYGWYEFEIEVQGRVTFH